MLKLLSRKKPEINFVEGDKYLSLLKEGTFEEGDRFLDMLGPAIQPEGLEEEPPYKPEEYQAEYLNIIENLKSKYPDRIPDLDKWAQRGESLPVIQKALESPVEQVEPTVPIAQVEPEAKEPVERPETAMFQMYKWPKEREPEEAETKPETLLPTISEAPEKTLSQRILEQITPFKASKVEQTAQAQNIRAIAKQTGQPISVVRKNYPELMNETMKRQEPTTLELIELGIAPYIAMGLSAHVARTLLGLATFGGVSEVINAAVSMIKDEDYQFLAGKGISDLLPEESSQLARETLDIAEFIGIGLAAHGVYKKAPAVAQKLTKDIFTEFKAPKKINIPADKVADVFRTGKEISPEELDLIKSLNLNGGQYRMAVKRGLDIEVPAEKITTIVDKPYWSRLKDIFGREPTEPIIRAERAEPIYRTQPAGLLERPRTVEESWMRQMAEKEAREAAAKAEMETAKAEKPVEPIVTPPEAKEAEKPPVIPEKVAPGGKIEAEPEKPEVPKVEKAKAKEKPAGKPPEVKAEEVEAKPEVPKVEKEPVGKPEFVPKMTKETARRAIGYYGRELTSYPDEPERLAGRGKAEAYAWYYGEGQLYVAEQNIEYARKSWEENYGGKEFNPQMEKFIVEAEKALELIKKAGQKKPVKPEVEELTAEKRAIIGSHVEELGSVKAVKERYPSESEVDKYAVELSETLFGKEKKPAKVKSAERELDEYEKEREEELIPEPEKRYAGMPPPKLIQEEIDVSMGKLRGKLKTKFKFLNPEIEERFNRAKGGAKDPKFVLIKAHLKNLWHKMSREYEYLPKTKEFAQLRFDLLELSKQKGVSSDKTLREIADITKSLDKTNYDFFTRKVILDDFAAMLEVDPDVALPFGLTKDNFYNEYERLNAVAGKSRVINDSIEKRNKIWDSIKSDYIKAMKDIGFNVEDRLTKKNYFRHQVLDYIRLKNAVSGTGRKLKTPAYRGFLKKRKGSQLDINTDYIQAEHEVMTQMTYDMEVAKIIKAVDENYNIKDRLKKEALEQSQGYEKAKPGVRLEYQSVTWEDIIPEGYVEWQPREGNVFYMADAIPASLAKQLTEGVIKQLGISKDDIQKVFALGGKRRSFVIKEEIAATLDNLTKEKAVSAIGNFDKKVIRGWKVWQLISPRRFFKYNFRNLTGDSDAVFCGNPSVFKKSLQASRELISAYSTKKELSGNVKDWFERGGMITTMQAQEMGELNRLSAFIDKYEKKGITDIPAKTWHKYWKTARITTDFRESILRYAAYLDYLEKIEKAKGGKLKNYGASIPEEIDGLKDPKDKAFWLSNDLLGAYDRVGVLGQHIREHIYPFWSWKEVNTRRYVRMFRNAASDRQFATTVGRKLVGTAVKSPYMLYRIGKFAIMASGFFAFAQVWNNLVFPDEEDDLSESVRNKPHIIFGRDSEGNIIYFSRIGALGDLLEWLNLDASPYYVNEMFKGRMSIKDVAKDMAKAPINILTQGSFPFIKLTGELATRRALFPDIFKPGTVRDRGLHIARSFGLESEYIALRKLPSRGYEETKGKFFYYKSAPLESAYWNTQNEKRRFLAKKGKTYTGFWLTPRGNALYNLKLAFRMGDKEAVDKYLETYALLGGTLKGFKQSIRTMNPGYGLNDNDKKEFLEYLDEEGREQLEKAVEFYNQFLIKIGTYFSERMKK